MSDKRNPETEQSSGTKHEDKTVDRAQASRDLGRTAVGDTVKKP